MNDKQYKIFMYCLKRMAGHLHFLEEGEKGIIKSFPSLNESSFLEVMTRNSRLVKDYHIGVCFTMAAYVKTNLLYSMGIEEDVYLMETYSPKEQMINFVVLYRYDGNWKICDLAEHVQHIEGCYGSLLSASMIMGENDLLAQNSIMENVKRLNDETYLAMSPEEYSQRYPMRTWQIYLDKGEENKKFTEIPKISFDALMQKNYQSGVIK